jgi:hypothetical protein
MNTAPLFDRNQPQDTALATWQNSLPNVSKAICPSLICDKMWLDSLLVKNKKVTQKNPS